MTGNGEVMLGYIHNGWVRAEFVASLLNLQQHPARELVGCLTAQSGGTLVSYARNLLAENLLKSPYQWLLMVDADMAFTPDNVADLAEAADQDERPVITGVCATLNPAGTATIPAIYRANLDATGAIFNFITRGKTLPADGVHQVDACGAAFLMIHRSVLEKIAPGEWFREGVTPSGGIRGEDLSFCVRASEAGFPIWAHCGVRPGHLKTVCLTAD
jgi:GT2 family glycosyltransferase